jgi:hypothetical protein
MTVKSKYSQVKKVAKKRVILRGKERERERERDAERERDRVCRLLPE